MGYSYERIRWKAAFKDTTTIWNPHRIWANLAIPSIALLSALLSAIARYMLGAAPSFASAALAGIAAAGGSLILLWVGSFALNYFWLTPAALHKSQQETIGSLKSNIAEKDEALKRKHAADVFTEETLRGMLSNFSERDLSTIRTLFHLGGWQKAKITNPDDIAAIYKGVQCGIVREIPDDGHGVHYEINGNYAECLKNLLHPTPAV